MGLGHDFGDGEYRRGVCSIDEAAASAVVTSSDVTNFIFG